MINEVGNLSNYSTLICYDILPDIFSNRGCHMPGAQANKPESGKPYTYNIYYYIQIRNNHLILSYMGLGLMAMCINLIEIYGNILTPQLQTKNLHNLF